MFLVARALHGEVGLPLLRLVRPVIAAKVVVVVVVSTPESPHWLFWRAAGTAVPSVVGLPVAIVTVFILHRSRVSPVDSNYGAFTNTTHLLCSLAVSPFFYISFFTTYGFFLSFFTAGSLSTERE